jgi:hypothetical protein
VNNVVRVINADSIKQQVLVSKATVACLIQVLKDLAQRQSYGTTRSKTSYSLTVSRGITWTPLALSYNKFSSASDKLHPASSDHLVSL